MKTLSLFSLLAVLIAASHSWASVSINVGTYYLLPGTHTLAFNVTGGDTVAGMNFCLQLGDGGVINHGTNTTPTITSVDVTPLFSGVPYNPPVPSIEDTGDLIKMFSITTQGANTVQANGTLALVTFNVAAGLPPAKFDIKLKDVYQFNHSLDPNDPENNGSLQYTNFADLLGNELAPTITNGWMFVLPGFHTMTWTGTTGNWEPATTTWSDSLTYPAGVTPLPCPDYTADAVIGSGTVSVAGGSRQANSVTVNGTGTLSIPAGQSLTTNQVTVGSGGTLSAVDGSILTTPRVQLAGGRLSGDGSFTSPIALDSAGGTVQPTTSLVFTLNGEISGSGGLTTSGGGTVVLGHSNSYTGGTTVSTSNVLRLGAAGALPGGGDLVVNSACTLDLNNFDAAVGALTGGGIIDKLSSTTPSSTLSVASGQFTGTLQNTQGTVALNKTGPGTLILYTSKTYYTGGTTISGGTLQLGSGDTVAATLLGDVLNNGTLEFNRYLGTTSHTFDGLISGTGSVKFLSTSSSSGSAATILTRANTYTGGTILASSNRRAVLTLNPGATLGPGPLTINNAIAGAGNSVTLNLNSAMTVGTLSGTIATPSSGTNTLTINLTGAATVLTVNQDTSGTFPGVIAGGGGVTKSGGETLVLTGSNTYAGVTTISSGTLQIGSGGATGSINGNVTDNAMLAFNRSGTYTFTGTISGSGGLEQAGSGTLVLSADSTYGGVTTISAGTLQIGNGGATGLISGDVVNNAALVFNRTGSYTLAGAITGSGTLTKLGGGTLVLTGDGTYSGLTTISAGALQIGNGGAAGSISGNILDNAALAFNRSDTYVFEGVISGSGSVTQAGSGTTILTGANTCAGGTTISAGTLQVGNSTTGSISGNIINNAALTFNRSDTYAYAGAISGSGSVSQSSTGTTIITGANTYGGGTTIAAGTLQIGDGGTTGSISGNVTDNAAMAINRSDSYTFAGAISGSGSLSQLGTGTTILTGNNTYGGGTFVGAGILQVNNTNALPAGRSLTIDAAGTVVLSSGLMAGAGQAAAASAVPEPGTVALLAAALLTVLPLLARRRILRRP